ncbi:MAG: hypothetical protein ACKO5K_10585, partial [Armatimonadota bacterium]
RDLRATAYLAPVGEPALGGAAYRHRPTAWDNPETSLSHHALEGSHVSAGVATLGLTVRNQARIEWSRFNRTETDENRFDIDPVRLDADSVRASWNPSKESSLQISRGWFGAMGGDHGGHEGSGGMPMAAEKTTVSAAWHRGRGGADFVSWYAAHALDKEGTGSRHRALLVEGAARRGDWRVFTRFEHLDKSDLMRVPEGVHRVGRLTVGGARILGDDARSERSVGASVGLHSIPSELRSAYGSAPVSVQFFYRIRSPRVR